MCVRVCPGVCVCGCVCVCVCCVWSSKEIQFICMILFLGIIDIKTFSHGWFIYHQPPAPPPLSVHNMCRNSHRSQSVSGTACKVIKINTRYTVWGFSFEGGGGKHLGIIPLMQLASFAQVNRQFTEKYPS